MLPPLSHDYFLITILSSVPSLFHFLQQKLYSYSLSLLLPPTFAIPLSPPTFAISPLLSNILYLSSSLQHSLSLLFPPTFAISPLPSNIRYPSSSLQHLLSLLLQLSFLAVSRPSPRPPFDLVAPAWQLPLIRPCSSSSFSLPTLTSHGLHTNHIHCQLLRPHSLTTTATTVLPYPLPLSASSFLPS